jgi:hypothetical protein
MADATNHLGVQTKAEPLRDVLERMKNMLTAFEVSRAPSVRSLEDMLRDYHGALEELPLSDVEQIQERVLEVGPLRGGLARLLKGAGTPEQIFQEVLDQSALEDLVESRRVMGMHVALAARWESEGDLRRSAAMFGLLLRLGLAGGQEELIARSAARLDVILQCQPEQVGLSMRHGQIEQLRRAWRLGTSHQAMQPVMLTRLAEQFQGQGEVSTERALGEIAVWERLLSGQNRNAQEVTPSQRSRALLRLLELYHLVAPSLREVARRGLELLPRWAAACRHLPALPVQTWDVLRYAADFERLLREAGSTQSRALQGERLAAVYELLAQKWPRHLVLGQLCLWLGQIRRELLGARLELGELASTTQLLRRGEESCRDPKLRMQLRGECYRFLAMWLRLGDREALLMATEMLAQYPEESEEHEVLLQRGEILLSLPGTDRQRRHNAQQCRKLAKRVLREAEARGAEAPVAHALLLRALAGVALNRHDKSVSLHPTIQWLRAATALLLGRLKETRAGEDRHLLGRALMAQAHVESLESQRWEGWNRRKLAEQALRDARQAMRIFKTIGCPLQSAETLWLQARALFQLHGRGEGAQLEEATRIASEGLDLLERHPQAQRYQSLHTPQGTLFENLRSDYVQLMSCSPYLQQLHSPLEEAYEPWPLDSLAVSRDLFSAPEFSESLSQPLVAEMFYAG